MSVFRQHMSSIRAAWAFCAFTLLSTVAFTATYNIEVEVRDSQDALITGVTFTVDGLPALATLNGSQNYVIKGFAEGDHLVRPFKAGVSFDYQEQSLTLPTDGETYSPNGRLAFTGHGAYTIGGQVYRLLADGTRQGIRNVAVTRGGSTQPATTDIDGNFSFAGLAPGTYTITPTLSGFQATPANMKVTVGVKAGDANNDGAVDGYDAPAILGQVLETGTAPGNADATGDGKVNVTDLIKVLGIVPADGAATFALTGLYTISGKIKSSAGSGLAGVKVVCTGSDATGGTDIPYATATSDASGNYSIKNLPPAVYTVIPVATDKVFAPPSASITLPTSGVAGAPNGSATFTAASGNNPSALLPLTYYHVKDSDGYKVNTGGIVMLVFEPNGIVDLYVAVTSDAIAYQGTYVYKSGKLTLNFTDPDFTRNATFTLDPAASTLTIPFKVFTEGSGSSTWTRHAHNVAGQLAIVFKAASLGLTTNYYDRAMARVMAYAQAGIMAQSGAPKGTEAPALAPARKITVVAPSRNGVTIKYDSGPKMRLILFGWSNTDGLPLTKSPIAGDPRLNLDCVPAEHFDPPNRRALLITPFFTNHNLAWYDSHFLHRNADDFTRQRYFHYSMEKDDNVVGMTDLLENLSHPYVVKQLKDENVTVQNLIDELVQSPGFVYCSTHGASDGAVATGVYLGDTALDTTQTIVQRYNAIVTQLNANPLYREIINYKAAATGELTTLDISGIARSLGSGGSPSGVSAFLSVTPTFWEALRVKGDASFMSSLVYISACQTDQTPWLRKAIQARAYFGFSTDVPSEFAGAVFQYLCKHLARRTHTPEEAYYNIIRVAGTRLKIYTEDELLESTIPRVEASSAADSSGLPKTKIMQVKDMFRGYGASLGTRYKLMPYKGNGWLTLNRSDFNPGVVWWHLFAARWGGDAQDSHDAIMNVCWKQLWSRGRTGGLANPGCNAQTSGRVPYPAELSYMMYLLTGAPYQFASPKLVPRWTLNDR